MHATASGHQRSGDRREAIQLGLLFGAIYFIQGIGEPTEGLIAQPVRSLLKTWGYSAAHISLFATLISVPWWLKPLYGWLSDFVPLAGSRRRSYLILTTAVTVLSLGYLSFAPLDRAAFGWLLLALVVPTVGVAFSDVVADALMVERGQPRGLTGRLQAVQWASMYAATVLVGSLGGFLSARGLQQQGFLICAAATFVTLLLAVFFVREPRQIERPVGFRAAVSELVTSARQPAVLGVGGFLFLWNFNPFSTSVLYLYMTQELGLDEQFYGHTVSLMSLSMIAASVSYGFYCRRVPFLVLVHASIFLGIVSTVAYWALAGRLSAAVISLVIGFTYMTANLIQLDFAARVCPPRTAATVFALLMALSNAGLSLAMLVGGYLYDVTRPQWGAPLAFNFLVLVGGLTTACCWLLLPLLAGPARQPSSSGPVDSPPPAP